jgi:Protein of unknown function (DUF2934)
MVTQDTIQERSYLIWEREGRPHGRDLDHWRIAEVELLGERAPAKSRGAKAGKSVKVRKTARAALIAAE